MGEPVPWLGVGSPLLASTACTVQCRNSVIVVRMHAAGPVPVQKPMGSVTATWLVGGTPGSGARCWETWERGMI